MKMNLLLLLGLLGPVQLAILADGAFLENALPLKPQVTTPVELLQGSGKVQMTGRQAITVVYSRPVIALGSDFGAADNFGGKVPFTLKCSGAPAPAGKFRWVTTTIARFDPDVDWPTDLDCTFTFNDQLTTYDGVKVRLPSNKHRQLTSSPLLMSIQDVTSDTADQLTGGQWSATIGMPDDILPEVPPDGVVRLTFNYPVNLTLIKEALQLQPNPNGITLNITHCVTPVYWIPFSKPAGPTTGDDACIAITFSKPLKDETKFELVLPSGSQYSTLTSKTSQSVSVSFGGLRAFRLPIRQDFQMPDSPATSVWDGVSYRRLKLWLPHGLKQSADVQALARQISLCKLEQPFAQASACAEVPITGAKLVGGSNNHAYLQLQVDSLQPHNKYRVKVAASSNIRDGFDKPLKASQGDFWTTDVQPYFTAAAAQPIAVFGKDLPASWPFMALGSDGSLKTASVWSLDVNTETDIRKLVTVVTKSDVYANDVLGKPTDQVSRGSPGSATQVNLPLAASKDVHVIAACCNQYNFKQTSANVQLVLRSQLAASWVVSSGQQVLVWVTSTAPDKPGPVEEATAYLYDIPWQGETRLVGQCKTDASGSCSVPMPKPDPSTSLTLFGVVQGPNKELVFTQGAAYWSQYQPPKYTGAVVLDRQLVRPGQKLYVTGYAGQKSSSTKASDPTVVAADVSTATLVITPGWTDPNGQTTMEVDVDATYGSLHTSVNVPASATVGTYQATLYVKPSTSLKGRKRSLMQGGPMIAPSKGGFAGPVVIDKAVQVPTVDTSNMVALSSSSFLVSDPRPPTADLVLTAPAWAPPRGKVSLQLQAISYLGSSVAAAPLAVVWHTDKAQDLLSVTTNTAGAATAVIDLSQLPATNRSDAGSSMSVEVSWVGPTRERITRTATVLLQDSSRRVVVDRTLDTSLPGVDWGVKVSVISNENNTELKGVPVEVTLRPNQTVHLKPGQGLISRCLAPQTCTFNTGDASGQDACQLSLPCVGHYVLEACTADNKPQACATTSIYTNNGTIGLNATEWELSPLATFDSPQLSVTPDQVKIGGTATLKFQNPYDAATALVVWGNTEQQLKQKLFTGLKPGLVKLEISIGAECKGDCSVEVIVSVPERTSATPVAEGVVVSKLFNLAGAHTHLMSAILNVAEDRTLDVSLSVSSSATAEMGGSKTAVVAPGGTATVSVGVSTQDGKPAANAEVTLIAVDKAYFDLVSFGDSKTLPDLPSLLKLSLSATLMAAISDDRRLKPGVVELVFQTLARRLKLDPWLPVDTTVFPGQYFSISPGRSAVDMNDTAYLNQYTSLLTYAPSAFNYFAPCGRRGPCLVFAAAPDPMSKGNNLSTGSGAGGSGSNTNVRVASTFNPTPLFTVVKTQANGKGQATFKAPANLGTFVVRAYAVQADLSGLGAGQTSLIVRRKLSLQASTPRIVRVGDTFMAGVLVTSPGLGASAAPFTSTVTLSVKAAPGTRSGPLKLQSPTTAKVTLSGSNNQAEVRFNFSAVGLGSAGLTFTVTDDSDPSVSDGLATTLPVLAQQSSVFLATSFALKPSKQATQWQEGLLLPAALPGSGSLDLTAGVGNLPAILAATNAVAAQRNKLMPGEPLDAVTALALGSVPPLLGAYKQGLSKAQQANASDAMNALVSLTDATLGLLPYKRGLWGFDPTRADIVLNAQAAWLLSRLPPYSSGQLGKQWAKVLKLVPGWRDAAARQLIQDATDTRHPPAGQQPLPYSDYYTLAWIRLALGAEWEVPACGGNARSGLCSDDAAVRSDLSLSRLVSEAGNQTLAVRVPVALALQASKLKQQYQAFISKTNDALISNMRVTGRTAYVAAYTGARSAAPLETQALALRFLRSLNRPNQAVLVQKLSSYVAAAGAASGGPGPLSFFSILPPITPSPWVVAVVASSLAAYDAAQGSTRPDLSLTAAVGKTTVLRAVFNSSTLSQPPVTSSTPWSKLPSSSSSKPAALMFNVKGKGEVSVAAGLSFVPAKPLSFPTYRGLWVSAAIQDTDLVTGLPTGPALGQAPLASLLTITLQVVSPDDVPGPVTVEALVAGGLEPLDPATTAAGSLGILPVCALADWAGDAWRTVFWFWWWPICPTQQVTPSSVVWKWQRLPAGTHTLSFRAVAASQGRFSLPPVRAYADNQPEVMGMTASSTFTVCGPDCKPAPAPTTTTPAKDCPNDCSGIGACNTSSGVCVCKPGWKGRDCSVALA